MASIPAPPRLVIFDLDGVIYRGAAPLAGAAQIVRRLRAAGVTVRFATNNATRARVGYVERLRTMGIEAEVDEIVTSVTATIAHLRRHAPEVHRVLAMGTPGMVEELRGGGFEVVAAADAAPPGYAGGPLGDRYDAVITGLDPEMDYRRVAVATAAVRAGARLFATNFDRRYPTADGFLPGAAAIVAAISAAADREPDVIGKPHPAIFDAILEATGFGPGEAIVVGDNPETDMVAASRAGIASVLVLTGVADADAAAALDGERVPDAVVWSLDELEALLEPSVSR